MRKISICCGWDRSTKVLKPTKVIKELVIEISCLECNGSGEWTYGYDDNDFCTCCRGTGKQYVGI